MPNEPCDDSIPDNCAFCSCCGKKNPNFDRAYYQKMHPTGRTYEETLTECTTGGHETFHLIGRTKAFADQRFCSDCGAEIFPL